jgi:hypothetical protein
MTGNMHSRVYVNRSTCDATVVALCLVSCDEYVTALAIPMQHSVASRSSALRIRYKKTPLADEVLGDRQYALAICLMRKIELHVSRSAMEAKYPICKRLMTT